MGSFEGPQKIADLALLGRGDVGLHSTWPRLTKLGLGPSDDLRFVFSGHRTSGETAPWRPPLPQHPTLWAPLVLYSTL